MTKYQRTITIENGDERMTIVVRAWPLPMIGANLADFLALVDAFVARVRDPEGVLAGTLGMSGEALVRVVRLSLANPEDEGLVRAPDLPDVLDAIWEVNAVGELLKKSLELRLRKSTALQAAAKAMGAPEGSEPFSSN